MIHILWFLNDTLCCPMKVMTLMGHFTLRSGIVLVWVREFENYRKEEDERKGKSEGKKERN